MEPFLCQSCGMPMKEHSDFGQEIDGRLSKEYCANCYQLGQFTSYMNMLQMINTCAKFWKIYGFKSQEDAVKQMHIQFPTLKRWKKV